MTQEEIKQASEAQLRARLGELRAMKRTKTINRDVDVVNAERFDAMSNALGKYDINKSMELQSKAHESRMKQSEKQQKKADVEKALADLSQASEILRADPNNQVARDQVRDKWNLVRSLGVSAQNPIDDILREQFNATQTGLKREQMAIDADRRKIEDERWEKEFKLETKNIEQDNALQYKQYQLALDKANKESTAAGTEGENKAVGFAARMKNSIDIINEVGPTLSKLEIAAVQADSPFLSSEARRYKLAVEDYIRAQLRQESGASIAPSEMKGGYSQYAYSAFDDDASKQDKMKRLELGFKSMESIAGKKAGNISKILDKKPEAPVIPKATATGPAKLIIPKKP